MLVNSLGGSPRRQDLTRHESAARPLGGGRPAAPPVLVCWIASATVSLVVGGCTADVPEVVDPAPAVSGSAPTSPPDCPPEGEGTCLGDLTARQIYESTSFRPKMTFSVPVEGWVNAEDYPGTFSLLAPGGTIAGINAQTSDYIGIATSIAPSKLTNAHGCVFQPLPGRWSTPQQVTGYFTGDPTLNTSQPRPASVGGLGGVVLDVRIRPHGRLMHCIVDGHRFRFGGSFSGVAPTELDHAVIPGETIRLYLLAHEGAVLLVELNDVDAAPGDMGRLEQVVDALQFGGQP